MWDWSDNFEEAVWGAILRVVPVSGTAGIMHASGSDVDISSPEATQTMVVTAIVYILIDFASARLSYLKRKGQK